ncbi:MAG TPA: 50S ribosomal protein L22 [Candidatus Krumholzibacteria bacterium]|nr:50S ribosomal protein L22 [Candidatus Krumholzibacteria bacterium]HPD72058.1 50S ribosomal protein L22 [Candidatus Krumholzibacteria bacterium]HRY41009.1 50S ribosomal protein L22 [Candidatus Krumholzibacteria bacterium]
MEAMAVSRYIRIAPRKARIVADLVRGRTVQEALSILALTPKKASPLVRKAILSAKANAQVRHEAGVDLQDSNLRVKDIRVDEGPTLKRIRPRAQGRAFRIFKRTSHIKVTVETLD